MRIASIDAFPIRLARDFVAVTGTAGSPTLLRPLDSDYRWSSAYPALYSVKFETALLRVTTDAGVLGWGEAQAPLAPEVACTIVDRLLKPVLLGNEFDPSRAGIERVWEQMYSTMRVRGQTGGFMLDAISAVDLALWDIAGKVAGQPVSRLIAGGGAHRELRAYVSGLGGTKEERRAAAHRFWELGFRDFKLFYGDTCEDVFGTFDLLRHEFGDAARVAVDALWRLTPADAASFGAELDRRHALWLEAPLPPEDPLEHAALARTIRTPLALGESYRTRYELAPFFRERAIGIVQPDLGRCGITEGLRIAAMAAQHGVAVVPHVSVAFGPQVAAALHYAAAISNCDLVEYNPNVLDVANRFLLEPLRLESGCYAVPSKPGLGIDLDPAALHSAGVPVEP